MKRKAESSYDDFFKKYPYYYGSEALKPDNDVPEVKIKRPVLYREKKSGIKEYLFRLRMISAIVTVFGGCFLFTMSVANTEYTHARITTLKNELKTLEDQNTKLKTDISEKIDLNFIELEAKSSLGMKEPESYQIIYIDVPKENYAVQYTQTEQSEEQKGFLKSLYETIFQKDSQEAAKE